MQDFKRSKNVWLLAALLLLLVFLPFFQGRDVGKYGGQILVTVVLLAAVYTSSNNLKRFAVAGILAGSWLILSWSGIVETDLTFAVARDVVLIGLFLVTLGVVLYSTLRAGEVTFDTLCGAASVYLLLAVTWGAVFRGLELLAPGSFHGLNPDILTDFSQFLYFSLTTLTTLGYGDITPASPVAGIWATLEAVTGVLYIAVLVARLVSLYRQ